MIKKKYSILWLALIFLGISSIASAEIIDRIVAVVNNDIITLMQLNKATNPYIKNIEASQQPGEQKEQMVKNLEKEMLQQLINRSLTTQEAIKYNIDVTAQEVDSAIDNFLKTNNLDMEGLEKGLAADGLNLNDYREKMKGEILQSRLISRAVRSKVIITDSDIKTYYDSHGELFKGVKKYHLRNIVMDSEEDIMAVKKKMGKEVSFAQLAKQYSLATNASEGGDLGIFDINNFSEEIKVSLQPLGKGEYTSILGAGQGYQILFVEDILLEGNKTLGQASDQIENILYSEMAEKQFGEWIDSLKKKAHIKIMLTSE